MSTTPKTELVVDKYISSSRNPHILHARRLRKRNYRNEYDQTVVEGFRELKRAIKNRCYPEHVFYCKTFFLGKNNASFFREIQQLGILLIETSQTVFETLSYRDRPDGWIGVAKQIHYGFSDILVRLERTEHSPLLLVVKSIEKPGNLGAMIRSADGAADGVIVCDRKTDINNPNVIRSSVGTLFALPVVETSSEKCISFLREQGIHLVSSSPSSQKIYWNMNYRQPTAFAVGSEQYGLPDCWLEDGESVCIPMLGQADSLNVSTAATLLLYEALRQRATGV